MPARSGQIEILPGHYGPEHFRAASPSVEPHQRTGRRFGFERTRARIGTIRAALRAADPQKPAVSSPEVKPLAPAPSLMQKLGEQPENHNTAQVVVFDVDGTVYSGLSLGELFRARKINRQTANMLREHHIPVITNSGARFAQFKMWALGLGTPDIIITGFGTQTKYKTRIPFVYRTEQKNGKAHTIRVTNTPLPQVTKREEELARPGYRVVHNESVLGNNTRETYSGTIAVIPESAGKDRALQRVLEATAQALGGKPVVAHVFGDSLGDESMIRLPSTDRIRVYGHAVEPKPLLRLTLLDRQAGEVRPGLYHERFQTGPAIHLGSAQQAILDVVWDITDHVPNPKNSPLRQAVHRLAANVNRLNWFTRHTAPNTITVNGFKKVTSATETLHRLGKDARHHFLRGNLEQFQLLLGNLDDFLDGLQAERLAGKRKPQEAVLGPFLDPLTDRAREIHALGLRAQDRLQTKPTEALTTYKAMVATVLPSLARSFVEAAAGNVVPEDAEGSSSARNKLLRNAARAQMKGRPEEALACDQALVIQGLKTFTDREAQAGDSFGQPIPVADFVAGGVEQDENKPKQTKFRNTAFMRMGMNVGILQQLDQAIRNALQNHPDQLAEYAVFMEKSGAQKYVALDPTSFPPLDERLHLGNFLQLTRGTLFAVQPHLPNVA